MLYQDGVFYNAYCNLYRAEIHFDSICFLYSSLSRSLSSFHKILRLVFQSDRTFGWRTRVGIRGSLLANVRACGSRSPRAPRGPLCRGSNYIRLIDRTTKFLCVLSLRSYFSLFLYFPRPYRFQQHVRVQFLPFARAFSMNAIEERRRSLTQRTRSEEYRRRKRESLLRRNSSFSVSFFSDP